MGGILYSRFIYTICREHVKTQDGGEILLDWYEDEGKSPYPSETRPTIVFLPGLTGTLLIVLMSLGLVAMCHSHGYVTKLL